ncbi:hypothetical protein KI387_025150, partial [Taxus chinensis]
ASPRLGGYRDVFCDGFTPSPTSVAPMFPFYENTNEWDEFGEVINPDDYIIKEEDVLDFAAPQPTTGARGQDEADEETEDILLDTKPSKVVSNEIT